MDSRRGHSPQFEKYCYKMSTKIQVENKFLVNEKLKIVYNEIHFCLNLPKTNKEELEPLKPMVLGVNNLIVKIIIIITNFKFVLMQKIDAYYYLFVPTFQLNFLKLNYV